MNKMLVNALVVVAAVILSASVLVKFTNALMIHTLFITLGELLSAGELRSLAPAVSSYGQYLVANLEMVALVLIMVPQTRRLGALLGLTIGVGAVLVHTLTPVGINLTIAPSGATDGGVLFGLSVTLSLVCLSLIGFNSGGGRVQPKAAAPKSGRPESKSAAASKQREEDSAGLENLDQEVTFDADDTAQLDEAFDQLLFDVKRVFHDEIVGEHKQVLHDSVRMLHSLPSQSKYFPRRPLIIPKLIRAVNNVASSKKDLVAVISHDPVLAGELLRVANSPFYRLSDEPVDSIGRAIVVLGIDGLKSMASTLVMQPVLQVKTSYFPQFSETVWLHSVKAALAAQSYARKTGACDSFQAHLLGLLSSIGHIVIFQMMMDIYVKYSGVRPKIEVLRTLRREHADQVSAIVVKDWNLSEEFVEVLQAYQLKAPVNQLAPLGRALYYGRLVAAAHMLFEAGKYDKEQIDEIMAARGLHPDVFKPMWEVLSDDKASLTAGTMVNGGDSSAGGKSGEPLRKSA